MKQILASFVFLFVLYACQSTQPDAVVSEKKQTDSTKKNYLPIAGYLKSEIASVDSFPQLIMRYHVINGKTDSGVITTKVFDQIAAEFIFPELDSTYFEQKFDENSFVDRATNLVSFTYSTKLEGNGLKRVDILLSPAVDGTDKLNSIYMEAISTISDSISIRKMSWKAGRNFRILNIQKSKSGPETTTQTIVIWDRRD
jgi:hypothetical protein